METIDLEIKMTRYNKLEISTRLNPNMYLDRTRINETRCRKMIIEIHLKCRCAKRNPNKDNLQSKRDSTIEAGMIDDRWTQMTHRSDPSMPSK